ncbi:hypothetical protein PTTG_01867 [Puccinia triticina 1-1 BBBD Race 1]|uniref:RNA polymerase II transcription factor B subunit 2 n=2 Tax=Puccinia triticina TaxID=208348 RepID=A0A180G9G3_PUCT1|nr:uncharacterized protein PtA15_11A526 [Puccinia triticina]OAV89264.1 hypothetical protein PTTG_01867 [Puccinia triticina 1-1 BBBD Race 1]WAQ89834.1 hypothetical protein PtA15_11A526 [Puccinia triticina]WAR59881.1 hypothetical protein PtB15_11B522 [Puccinia triticina]
MASLRSTTTVPANSSKSSTGDFTSALYAFLNALPKLTLARLYNTPASCLAIFRLLPLIGRHLVLNMIWSEDPIRKSEVELWADINRPECKTQLDDSLTKLFRLNIIEESFTSSSDRHNTQATLILNRSFQQNFRRALTGGGNHCSFGVPCNTSPKSVVPIDELDRYGTEKWETILHYMVGSRLPTKPSHNILTLLGQSGLMTSTDPRSLHSLKITSKGFGFLLEDVNTQLWDILLQYLKMTESHGLDIVDVLACLFMLGSLELGQEYSFSNWTSTQTQVLQDLVDYGLVLVTAPDRFYPTRLATTLTSTAPPLVSAERLQEEHGFLVLETNYRIYAYTSNPLQIAVLNLFLSLRYRFPNLVVGAVTRESIKSALSNGITADQVIMYLHTHAHPQMRKVEPLLPPTVVDQIRLWELEKNRIQAQDGYLYQDFRTAAEYDSTLQYSKKLGIVLWEHAGLRKFFIECDGHAAVREFVRRGGGSNGNM